MFVMIQRLPDAVIRVQSSTRTSTVPTARLSAPDFPCTPNGTPCCAYLFPDPLFACRDLVLI